MKRRVVLSAAMIAVCVILGAGDARYRIVEQRIAQDWKKQPFAKLVVIGITDDIEARKNFENKFVSHLRGREIEGVTSYSLVPNLAEIEDEEQVIRMIHELKVDGAITVRLVPLTGSDTSGWAEGWQEAMDSEGDLRLLIDESLPTSTVKASRYGLEIALWETQNWQRVWGGRTDAYTLKHLKKGSGEFVQLVMRALATAYLL